MVQINAKTKTLICIGTGGVGKTTVAAGLAYGFANEGKKVLVLTIDPSQRLAQALGVKPDGEVYPVQKNLFACTINHEKAFRDFVLKATESQKPIGTEKIDSEKLFNNKLYKQLSTQLSGSQDFSSLFKLNEFVQSKIYDLVILDTPPAQHTWGFLHAPEKIAQLFNEGVAQWFRDPEQKSAGFLKKVLNVGTTQVLKALEALTGSEFVKELALFFQAIQTWQGPLEKQVWDCHKLLTSTSTEFILVTALDSSRINEALKLSSDIEKQGYNLRSIIINRVPQITNAKPSGLNLDVVNYISYLKLLEDKLVATKNKFGPLLKIYKSFELSDKEIQADYLKKLFNQLTQI